MRPILFVFPIDSVNENHHANLTCENYGALQILGLGLGKFFKDGFNIFDLMVVILSQVRGS